MVVFHYESRELFLGRMKDDLDAHSRPVELEQIPEIVGRHMHAKVRILLFAIERHKHECGHLYL